MLLYAVPVGASSIRDFELEEGGRAVAARARWVETGERPDRRGGGPVADERERWRWGCLLIGRLHGYSRLDLVGLSLLVLATFGSRLWQAVVTEPRAQKDKLFRAVHCIACGVSSRLEQQQCLVAYETGND
jgi:hypothetical protein